MQFSLFGVIYLLSLNKYLFYGLFLPLFFILSVVGFWGFTQDISLSAGVIQASLETQADIVFGLISWQLVLYILLIIALMYFLVKQYNKVQVPKFNYVLCILSLLSFLTFFVVESKRGGTFKNRLPYTLYFESQKLYKKNKVRFEQINQTLVAGQDSIQFIFVLGESVRADHLQLNGYERQTTPLLSQRKNLISYTDAFTTNTYTGASVPQILSNASVFDDYKTEKKSLMDVLNKANIQTVWIGNQTPEKSYLTFIENSTKKFYIDPTHSEFSFNKELDEKMIPVAIEEWNNSGNQFSTIHMMGSHWWYENRYDDRFRVFKPVIKSKYIPSNSPEEMINSYDNTILYLDYFLNELINHLEKLNTTSILFFVSDHGELLGENGNWLHAQPGDEKSVRNPAVIIWYSDKFKNKYPTKIDNLYNNQNKYLPLDFFYHSVLDAYEIKGVELNPDLSIFRDFKFRKPD
ncbi:MAG TPA: sulfatase-like hydrolase/transferase [Moheibacter sp.]|nr:sulfatase-like hydrolase/transferase [Moheibacter sp.]